MKIVNVIPLKKGILKSDLTYFTTKNIENGSIVSVNLRAKKVLALVVSVERVSDTKINIKDMGFNLKKIIEVKDRSVFSKKYIESALLAGTYFASSKSDAIVSLVPAIFREEYDKISSSINESVLVKKSEKNIRSEKLLLQEQFKNRISIYKTLIRENFAQKKSIYIVLPTEGDIKIFEEQLSKGIEQFTFTLHGGFTGKKTIEKFKAIVTTEHPVLMLGTVPFLSVPRGDIGVIVLEHESSGSYKMIRRPHFDLRVFAEIFASKINAKFILADELLRFETLARRELEGLVSMHPLSFRIDMKGEIETENPKRKPFKIFSEKSIQNIKNSIANKENVFIFTLRKGLATQTVCSDCGETVNCEKCMTPLVLYNSQTDKGRFFACNRCNENQPQISGEIVCTYCKSWNLKPLGIGTDTVFEEMSSIFPKNKVLKLDKTSTKNKKGAENMVKDFENIEGGILIGTEMALHYLKEKVALSIVASFDSFWSVPNFKMSEKIIQLVISIISKTENKFIIQTRNEQDPAILAIQSKNLLPFVRTELEDRERLSYPPFMRFIKIKHTGNKAETMKAQKILEETFKEYQPLIFSGFVAQLKGKYITNALIKIETKNWSLPELSLHVKIDKNLSDKLMSLPPSFEIFVDPEDLL